MNADNPYEPPQEEIEAAPPVVPAFRQVGTTILLVGLATLTYGAVAFWLINWLPPNGPAHGRLPSVYVMGVGIVITFIGLIGRDLRIGRKTKRTEDGSPKGIPTSYGILGLVVILLICFAILCML